MSDTDSSTAKRRDSRTLSIPRPVPFVRPVSTAECYGRDIAEGEHFRVRLAAGAPLLPSEATGTLAQ